MIVLSGTDLAMIYAAAYSKELDPEQARNDAEEAMAGFVDGVASLIGERPHIGTTVTLDNDYPRIR